MKSFLRDYRQEVFVGLLAIIGAVLLLNRRHLNFQLDTRPQQIQSDLAQLNSQLSQVVHSVVEELGTMGLIGLGVAVLAAAYLIWRIRYHYSHSERFVATKCPRCGSELVRIHRTSLDRLLSATLLPKARRYECTNESCGWEGLRRRRHHHASHPHAEE